MKAKEYLSQAYVLDRRLKLECEKVEKLMSVLEYKSPSFECNGSFGSGNNDKVADTIAKIIDYKRKYEEIRRKYVEKYREIENVIMSVDDEVEREILERRYLLYEPWDSRYDKKTGEYIEGIADKMGYTVRWVHKRHGFALAKIKVPES